MIRNILIVAFAIVTACGCESSVVGDSCEVSGNTNEDIVAQTGDEACEGGTCLFYRNEEGSFGSFCTDSCMSSGDCPNGMVCETLNLDPTGNTEELKDMCIPDEPVEPAGDDDDFTYGTAPEISEFRVWFGPDMDDPTCYIHHELTWDDAEGDLSGAMEYLDFVEADDPDVVVPYATTIEHQDTEHVVLTFKDPMEGSPLKPSTRYHVYVEMKDRGENMSNQLTQTGFVTPDASCE